MNFNFVVITDWKDRTSKFMCDNKESYMKHLIKNPDMCELIGGTYQQIKPVFDVDAYETDPNIDEILAEINKVFPDKYLMINQYLFHAIPPIMPAAGLRANVRLPAICTGAAILRFSCQPIRIDERMAHLQKDR